MNKREIDTIVAGTNPVSFAAVEALPLAEVEGDLVREITAEPAEVRMPNLKPRRFRRGGRQLALAGAVCAVALAILIAGGAGDGSTVGLDKAVGDDIERLLKASPPIVIDAPGWKVEALSEPFESEGTTQFSHDYETESGPETDYAELQWLLEPMRRRVRAIATLPQVIKRSEEKTGVKMAPYVVKELAPVQVLGAQARIFTHREFNHSLSGWAIWRLREHTFQLRTNTPGVAGLRRILASMREIEYEAWLDALPPTIVKQGQGIVVKLDDVRSP
ncbi:MAG TPA: hypothetical protein VFX45_00620 [Solirubrobacterales bacterium]|nr:hypothetical protein [Solirubrobacterales bacterium]